MNRRTIRNVQKLLLIPAVLMAAGACFATRNDVRTLQGDIAVLRAENARSDSLHRAQFQLAAGQLAVVADSLRAVNASLTRFAADVSRFQGDLSITMHTFGQQLLTIQELGGQTQKRIQDIRAEFERQQADLANAAQPTAQPAPGAAAPPPAGGTQGGQPGPGQLFNAAFAQFNRGAYGAARAGFTDFLAQYPNDVMAGEAQYDIAHSYDLEGNAVAADSAYAVVVDKYPKTEHASSALYKRAVAARQAGNNAKARSLFQQLLTAYPRSPEADLATDALSKIPK